MPTVAEQRVTALAQLRLWLQPGVEPKLTDEEVDSLIDSHVRASIWATGTAYTYGQVVLPTVRNGHRYRCVQAGTSGATEPTWSKTQGVQQSEGTSSPVLTWEEYGVDYDNVYDVRHATHDGWMLKASRCANLYQDGDSSYEQVHKHCLSMAAIFASLGVA